MKINETMLSEKMEGLKNEFNQLKEIKEQKQNEIISIEQQLILLKGKYEALEELKELVKEE